MNLSDLIPILNGKALRVRISLWLMPVAYCGRETLEAATYGIEAVDIREKYLSSLDPETRFANLTSNRVLDTFEKILIEPGTTQTVLIYNLDLLLAHMDEPNRTNVWDKLYQALAYRPRGAVIAYPATAIETLPKAKELEKWRQDERLVESAV